MPTSNPGAWAAIGSIFAAVVVTWGADVVSRRRERNALGENYTSVIATLRARAEDSEAEQTRLRGLIGKLRRRIIVLRLALISNNVPVPPDTEDADF